MDESWEGRLLAFLDDLEDQAASAWSAERDLEVAERARAEYARVDLAGRLTASLGSEIQVTLDGAGSVAGVLRRVADGWCLVKASGAGWIVPVAAVVSVRGAGVRSVATEARAVTARLGLGSALRGLAGEQCLVWLRGGSRLEARIGRVGADFVEVHAGEDRMPTLVPFAALSAVVRPS